MNKEIDTFYKNIKSELFRPKFDAENILKTLPRIFGRYYLLSNYKTKIPYNTLTIKETRGKTITGKEIPIFLVNSKGITESLKLDGKRGRYTLEGGDRPYNQLDISIPNTVRLKGCGCVGIIGTYGDFNWFTKNSDSPDDFIDDGGIYALNTNLESAIDDDTLDFFSGYNVVGAIVFGPDLVGLRLPSGTDETTGCLIVNQK